MGVVDESHAQNGESLLQERNMLLFPCLNSASSSKRHGIGTSACYMYYGTDRSSPAPLNACAYASFAPRPLGAWGRTQFKTGEYSRDSNFY